MIDSRDLKTSYLEEQDVSELLSHGSVQVRLFNIYLLTVWMCTYVGGCVRATVHTWRSEDNFSGPYQSSFFAEPGSFLFLLLGCALQTV